jgi:hypothetical protein
MRIVRREAGHLPCHLDFIGNEIKAEKEGTIQNINTKIKII